MTGGLSSYVKIYVADDFSGEGSLHMGLEVQGTNGPYTDKRFQVDYYPPPQGRYVGLTSGGFSDNIYEVEVYPTGEHLPLILTQMYHACRIFSGLFSRRS